MQYRDYKLVLFLIKINTLPKSPKVIRLHEVIYQQKLHLMIMLFIFLNIIYSIQSCELNENFGYDVKIVGKYDDVGELKTFTNDYEEIEECTWTPEQECELQKKIQNNEFNHQKFNRFHYKFIAKHVMNFDCFSGSPYCQTIFFLTNGLFENDVTSYDEYHPQSDLHNDTEYESVIDSLSHKIREHMENAKTVFLLYF